MNVRFYGYFAKNLGDDLFFKIALERYPDVDFYLDTNFGYFPEFMFSYSNLHYLPTTRFFNSLFFCLLISITIRYFVLLILLQKA